MCVCEEEVEEEPEEEETDLSLSPEPPSPPDYFTRSYTPPPSGPPSPPYSSKPILTLGGYEANGPSCLPCGYPFRGVRRPPGYALCPSCSGLLPNHMHRHEGLRNGGGRVSYQQPQPDFDVQSERDSFRKMNLIRWVTMHEVVAHRSFSTDV
ncbi:protein FAM163B [Alosa alosa]|uniref:protein FAM163B n=1 Tax=Alosa sapidissima TaxID=34773 RepID=UPI001C093AD1|nr:protein FAM163B [Alosa sapidissima]XP_048099460.1 protein FAM163B [Alosa alosa]